MMRHQLRGLHTGEVDAGCLARAVAEGSGAGGGETAFVADCDVCGDDAGHAGDVDDSVGHVCGGAFGQEAVEADGGVEDGFDVESHEFVPA